MSLIYITLIVQLLKYLLYLLLMVIICCTDKLVIWSIHEIPYSLDLTWCLINEFLWGLHVLKSLVLDLLSMLICSCHESYIITCESLVPCNAVSQHDLVGVAYMRFTWCICNGGCNIIRFFCHFKNPPWKNTTSTNEMLVQLYRKTPR